MGRGLIFKLMTWGIIAGVALIIATQLLGSVSWVVISLRLGNPIPFVLVVASTLLLQRIAVSITPSSPVVTTLLDVAAWASVVYLFFVLLVGLIPYGLVIAISAAGLSVVGCMVVRDPSDLKEKATQAADMANAYRGVGFRSGPDKDTVLWAYLQRQDLEILQLPRGSFSNVVSIIKDRPMLPAVLLHFEHSDFLIVRNSDDVDWNRQIKRVLLDAGVFNIRQVSPLLRKAILLMPILDEHDGLKIRDYVVAINEKSIQVLIDHSPERMTLFPHSEGIRIVVRKESIPGIEVESIPSEYAERVVVGREIELVSNIFSQSGGSE
ncbi:MAG: hypothetical protein ACFFF4_12565 [Candidatus Thorarchaeota archaeon]